MDYSGIKEASASSQLNIWAIVVQQPIYLVQAL